MSADQDSSPVRKRVSSKASIFNPLNVGSSLSDSIKRHWHNFKQTTDEQKNNGQEVVSADIQNDVIPSSTMYDYETNVLDLELSDSRLQTNQDTNPLSATTEHDHANPLTAQSMYPDLGAVGIDNTAEIPFASRLHAFKYGSEDPNLNQYISGDSQSSVRSKLGFSDREEGHVRPPPYTLNGPLASQLHSGPQITVNAGPTTPSHSQQLADLAITSALNQPPIVTPKPQNIGQGALGSVHGAIPTSTNPFHSAQTPLIDDLRLRAQGRNLITQDTHPDHNNTPPQSPVPPDTTDMSSAVRFDTFSGRIDEDFIAWKKHTERNLKFLNWDARKCAAYIPTLLQDKALRYYETLSDTITSNKDAVFESLTTKFSTAAKGMLQINKLLERTQRDTETVEEYSRYITQNFSTLGISDEFTKITHFVAGLKPHLGAEVIKANPSTLEDVEQTAMLAELAHKQTHKLADRVDQVLMLNTSRTQAKQVMQSQASYVPDNRFCIRCHTRHPFGVHTQPPVAQFNRQPQYRPSYSPIRQQFPNKRPNGPNFNPPGPYRSNWRPQRPQNYDPRTPRQPNPGTVQQDQQNRQSPECYNCQGKGHFARNCPKRLN